MPVDPTCRFHRHFHLPPQFPRISVADRQNRAVPGDIPKVVCFSEINGRMVSVIDLEYHECNHHCREKNIGWKEKIEGVIRVAG
jgi:hypothetical protein